MLEKTLESPLDSKEIKAINPKWNQPWIFIGRTDGFQLWCWSRLHRVPWTARKSNQSILREINPEYSLERLMLKLMLQYSGHVTQRADSLEKTLMLGKRAGREAGDRGWDGWITSPTQWIWVWASSRRWWRTGKPGLLQFMGSQRVGHDLATEQQEVGKQHVHKSQK